MPIKGNVTDKVINSENKDSEADISQAVFYSKQSNWESRSPSPPAFDLEAMSESGEATPPTAAAANDDDHEDEFLSLRGSGEAPFLISGGQDGRGRPISAESWGSLTIDGRLTRSADPQQVLVETRLKDDSFLSSRITDRDYKTPKTQVPPVRVRLNLLQKDAQTYELEKFHSNVMYIFNHYEIDAFKDKEPRLGTEADVLALQKTFSKFGFKVLEYLNYTKQQIFDALKELSKSDLSEVGCIMIAVLSHGEDDGKIYANDGTYHEAMIMDIFHVANNPTLNGKPISFFVQACRHNPLGKLRLDARQMHTYTMPEEADMLLLHSTYNGRVSVRHTTEGSWFIQELCKQINNFHFEDLQSIITRVLRSIAVEKEFRLLDDNDSEVIIKQMPVCMTTLTRKLYLVLKIGSQVDYSLERIEKSHQFHEDNELINSEAIGYLAEDGRKILRQTDLEVELYADISDGLETQTGFLFDSNYNVNEDDASTLEPSKTELLRESSQESSIFKLEEVTAAVTGLPGGSKGRSRSAGDPARGLQEPCAKCAVLGNEAKLGCILHFDYLWKIFTDYLEVNEDHIQSGDACYKIKTLKDWQEVLDRENVNQIKLLTRYLVEYFTVNSRDWPSFPFLYFGQYFIDEPN